MLSLFEKYPPSNVAKCVVYSEPGTWVEVPMDVLQFCTVNSTVKVLKPITTKYVSSKLSIKEVIKEIMEEQDVLKIIINE